MKKRISSLVLATFIFALLTKGILWDREFSVFVPTGALMAAEPQKESADGSKVIGRLVVPAYFHWVTGRQSEHDVRVSSVSKRWEYDDHGTWREMPARTSYIFD